MPAEKKTVSLRARYVFPVVGPPLAGGVVTLDGDQIVSVAAQADGPVVDLGNVAILPGLVNAHTHLEFSELASPLGTPGNSLVDWIRQVVAWRRSTQLDIPRAIAQGLAESALCGVGSLGEIDTGGWNDATQTEIPVILFRELLGFPSDRVEPLMQVANAHLNTAWSEQLLRGLSPHAPYTVGPELLCRAVELAVERNVPLAMHLAESPEELELLRTGSGPFRELLESVGAWQADVLPLDTRVLDYLVELSAARRALVVHGNYLDDEELAFLAQCRDHMAVVYCPRTHRYFGHAPYRLAEMLQAGVNVCVGTDSRASNPDLNLFAELQTIAAEHPQVAPVDVLQMGTLNGARMIGDFTRLGVLHPGASARLAVVQLPDRAASDPHELLFDPSSSVASEGLSRLAGDAQMR